MADPFHTFYGDHYYSLAFTPGTGAYTVGVDNGAYAIGDDEGDLVLADGSAGDGAEVINEALRFDSVPTGDNFAGSYTGQMIDGSPIIMYAANFYLLTDVGGLTGTSGTATTGDFVYPVCFVRGTHIATLGGECAIESLNIGDLVITASGASKPVKWVGRMSIPLTRFNRAAVTPVCIRQGALGHGLPRRDLHVSHDHAIAVDGVLVIAGLLVNGDTIVQTIDYAADVIDYFHVELEQHDLLLAEGLATESLYDSGETRAKFDNAAEFHALYPDFVPGLPMALGRVSSMRQLPKALRAKLLGGLAA